MGPVPPKSLCRSTSPVLLTDVNCLGNESMVLNPDGLLLPARSNSRPCVAVGLTALPEDAHSEPCPGVSGGTLLGMDSAPRSGLPARGVSATAVP